MKLFGAGIILSTGFVHMLSQAAQNLMDPCLVDVLPEGVSGSMGLFAMVGALFIQLVQVLASKALTKQGASRRMCSGGTDTTLDEQEQQEQHRHADYNAAAQDAGPPFYVWGWSPALVSAQACAPSPLDRHSLAEPDPSPLLPAPARTGGHHGQNHGHDGHQDGHTHALLLLSGEKQLSIFLLELSIAVHSILVGMTLGLAREEFVTLWIALSFHQFFEGFALSTTVLEADFPQKWVALLLMVLYALVTPLGMVLGMAVHLNSRCGACVRFLCMVSGYAHPIHHPCCPTPQTP
jgi:zinc transporter 1/2/3